MALVADKDLRNTFGPARDQHSRPTCLAFALSDTHASLRGGWTPLSCEYLYYFAQRRTGRDFISGSTIRGGMQAMEFDGQPVEADWCYSIKLPDDLRTWAPPAGITTVYKRPSNFHGEEFDAVISHLDKDHPVVLAIKIGRAHV